MKKFKYFLLVFIFFISLMHVKADLVDYNTGNQGSLSGLGSGDWYYGYVGLKISILDSNGVGEDSEIILNLGPNAHTRFSENTRFSSYLGPKILNPNTVITWTSKKENSNFKYYINSSLPSDWKTNNVVINLSDLLSNNSYSLLKELLTMTDNNEPIFNTLSAGDYIIIEPMVYIGDYYGTAFEFANSFLVDGSQFYDYYSGAVFGGTSSRSCGGVLWTALYLDSPVLNLEVYTGDSLECPSSQNEKIFFTRNNCFKDKNCGRGIGVYEYNKIFEVDIEDTCNTNTLGCLSGQISESEYSLRYSLCYDKELTDAYGDIVGFCKDSLHISNNLNLSTFHATSGEFLLKKDNNLYTYYDQDLIEHVVENNKGIATATSKRICYIFNGKQMPESEKSPLELSTYLGGVQLSSTQTSTGADPIVGAQFTTYEFNRVYNLDLGQIYLEKISGKPVDHEIPGKTETVFGLLSKFNDTAGSLEFKIEYDGETYTSDECKYELTPKIIDFSNNSNGKLNLEFRTVDTNNPFINRNTKTNWCAGSDCSSNNSKVQSVIKDGVNSYGLSKDGKKDAKYKITLTPSDIKIIRGYNENISYDNFLTQEVTYGNTKEQRNSFLYNLELGRVTYETNAHETVNKSLSGSLYNSEYQ